MLKAVRDSLLSTFFPIECRVCHGPVESLDLGPACRACWTETRIFDGSQPLCLKCGAYPGDAAMPSVPNCSNCKEHHYDSASASGIYEKALAASVILLKNDPVISARAAAAFLAAFDRSQAAANIVVMPVPLSRQRRIERGFNQAEVLCTVLRKCRRTIVDDHTLTRTGHTSMHRAAMDNKARESSVRGVFEVVRPKLVEDKDILLVDDVLTSGATASFCAEALKKSGARTVKVLTLARAVSD